MIRRIEESRSRAIRVRRAAAQKRVLLRELENRREESKAIELYLTDLLIERWWSRWSREETTSLPVSPGLVIRLTITQDISPGKRKAEGTIKAKGQVITWTLVAEVKLAQSRKGGCSEEEKWNMSIS